MISSYYPILQRDLVVWFLMFCIAFLLVWAGNIPMNSDVRSDKTAMIRWAVWSIFLLAFVIANNWWAGGTTIVIPGSAS